MLVQNSNYSKVDRWLLGVNAMPKPLGWYLRYWGPSFRKFCDLVQIWTKSQNFLTKRPSIGTKKRETCEFTLSTWCLESNVHSDRCLLFCYHTHKLVVQYYSSHLLTSGKWAIWWPLSDVTRQGGCMFCELGTAQGLVRTCHPRFMHLPAFCMD